LVVSSLPVICLAQQGVATLRFVPQPLSAEAGSTFTVDVWVDDVVDLYGAQIYIDFDPSVLEVQDLVAGGLWGSGPYAFQRLHYDNGSGQIDVELALRDPAEPLGGSGSLVTVTFLAKTAGSSSLNFVSRSAVLETMLTTAGLGGDTSDMEIPTDLQNGQVTVYSLWRLEVTPSTASVTAGQAVTYAARVYDQSDNLVDTVTGEATFSIDAAAGGSFLGPTYTSAKAGSWTVTASYTSPGGKTLVDTAALTVLPAGPDSLAVAVAQSPIAAGSTTTVTATVTDAYGNPVADGTAVTFTCSAGDFGGGATTYTATTSGGVALASYSATVQGTATLVATAGGASDSAQIVVTAEAPGPPARLEIAPSDASLIAGESVTYSAELYDGGGNLIDVVTADTTFSIEASAGGSWLGGATYVSEKAGTWTVTGRYSGDGGTILEGTASLEVTPGPARMLEVSAAEADVSVGSTTTITATVTDAYGNPVADGTAVTFTCNKGDFGAGATTYGTTTSGGVAVATFHGTGPAGMATISATAGDASDSTQVMVSIRAPAPGGYEISLPLIASSYTWSVG